MSGRGGRGGKGDKSGRGGRGRGRGRGGSGGAAPPPDLSPKIDAADKQVKKLRKTLGTWVRASGHRKEGRGLLEVGGGWFFL